ncbi:hypothetical protein BD324DRAFT_582319 [Kockovaella imperatae]|uniref:Uncharacterized protein n=1 Tax=Kockovaella imperatae TaxID=4999 RepID=A0A1Y1UBM6_9TREE|nr:hypothetical protein BD324DRAFT_582319 [Kockovaella imperatae]ORX35441.1 hypothetical protein BD324DRAFT_582319 [Kockovaella imperatae]
MPLHLPHLGHHRSNSHSNAEKSAPESFIPQRATSPRLQPRDGPLTPHRTATTASTVSTNTNSSSDQSQQPSSILRKGPTTQSSILTTSSIDTSGAGSSSSTSGSAYVTKKMNSLAFDRTDTISSTIESDEEDDGGASTPATSVSSFAAQCPLPASSASQKFPFFVLTLSSTSTLSFIALPLAMRPIVLDAVQRAWKKGIQRSGNVDYAPELMKKHKDKGCEGGVWEVTLKGSCWMPTSQEKVQSKRILVNLMTEFAREGYSLTSSFRTSKKDSGKDTLMFLRGEPDPDPVFFSVAFHSSDRVWIIDSPADVGQVIEEGIKQSWLDGVQAARTRERHCREIRLRGNPWTAHSTSALISARCIQLVIMKLITHSSRGYDFVGSVDMADLEEGELPTTFYRAKWGPERAVWDMAA